MYTLNCKGRLLVITEPIVMGILNITPDSFYEESRYNNPELIIETAGKMIEEGAAVLDIGGQSTRPGSQRLLPQQELQRVLPVIELIRREYPQVFISIDTYSSVVAASAVQAGADLINDISAGEMDAAMLPTAARLQVPYVAMHMQGTPETMQQNPVYDNVTRQVIDFFIQKNEAFQQAGINDVILDPGFGFGKTIEHNFQLLNELDAFGIFHQPLMVGLSRKSTIYKTLGITAQEALNGTTVLNTISLLKGASILRVHDVKEAVQAVRLLTALKKA
jgi:dihydropteroate synthase